MKVKQKMHSKVLTKFNTLLIYSHLEETDKLKVKINFYVLEKPRLQQNAIRGNSFGNRFIWSHLHEEVLFIYLVC